ncbi:MAG: dephospho-CoA kinase [Myxococcales bacterium]|nr:dephospho-CoA kinase [Myxococcales bacterium]
MKVVGLTGGLASGKSVVTAIFRELGAATLDADQVAHDLLHPGRSGHREVVRRFGPEILTAEGAIDRGVLGRLVFQDPQARRDLEAIVHPLVYQEIAAWIAAEQNKNTPLAIIEIPLLFESVSPVGFHHTICVTATRRAQIDRAKERSGYDETTIAGILAAQMPPAEQARRADFTIDNSGDLAATRRQVAALYEKLVRPS